jgi:hypothetical protein
MENHHSYNAPRRLVAFAGCAAWALVLAMAAGSGGCTVLAALTASIVPDPTDPPVYTSMTKQKCGIMVLTDPGTRIERPDLELDVARSLQSKLQTAIDAKAKELDGLTLVDSASVAKYMDNHPELEAVPIANIAARLPLTRLIYIDVDDFSTRPQETIDLYRGDMKAKISVVEIAGGKATVTFTSDPIEVVDPKGTPAEGTPNATETALYAKTIDDFTTKCAELFITHPHEEDSQ